MARSIKSSSSVAKAASAASASICTALYIRVSTEKQVDEGFSLEAQEARLLAFCEAQQWDICEEHIYIDAGVSGKSTDKRDAFSTMLRAAADKKIGRIVCIKLDRLARNTKDFLSIVDTLQHCGCDLVLIKESFDTSTPQGKFALTMFAAIAKMEASTITERMMTGKAQKASNGGYNGSQCPYGIFIRMRLSRLTATLHHTST